MVIIKDINSKRDLKKFVSFPFSLYKNSPYWVPPIISEELKIFNKDKNPAFLDADAYFFLAYRNQKIVGRIAVIINWVEVKKQKISKVRFGWFDFIDDLQVSKALLDKAYAIGKKHQLSYMEGPMGFSNFDKVGVLTKGFDHIGTMVTWYNYEYYEKHLQAYGCVKEKEYLENKIRFDEIDIQPFTRTAGLIKRRYQLKVIRFSSHKKIMPLGSKIFDLFNQSYASLASFVPINETQKAYFTRKYIRFINPEYLLLISNSKNELIGFSIVMSSFSKVLQKIQGKLFPFGFLQLLKAKNSSETIIFYLIGVRPDYQNKGVHAIIFEEYYKTFSKKKVKWCIRTPELIENKAIHNLWKNFNSTIHKRRKTYKKQIH